MAAESCTIAVKVLAVDPMGLFTGKAILAHHDPRFVVALLIEDTEHVFNAPESNLTFAVHRVAFFAIHSVSKLFMESEVVGNRYSLCVESETIEGRKLYFLHVV